MRESITSLQEIKLAARQLEIGKLVVFPTETVYGLGADAENSAAVASVYTLKERPSDHPMIVHIAPEADIDYWVGGFRPPEALVSAFWPGPLTLILPRALHISDQLSGGQSSIGLRCPSHPIAQTLLREFKNGKGGIVGPSANKFGHISPTTAQHVYDDFGLDINRSIACILDGGQSEVGIESTIIDLSRFSSHGPVLLRPGHISAAQISEVLGSEVQISDPTAPRVSGTLESHYAPITPVLLVPPVKLASKLEQLYKAGNNLALIHYSLQKSDIPPLVAYFSMGISAQSYAYDLYYALRAMDNEKADLIVIESPPLGLAWRGINDRLRRASYVPPLT